jgi:hypothetical protein
VKHFYKNKKNALMFGILFLEQPQKWLVLKQSAFNREVEKLAISAEDAKKSLPFYDGDEWETGSAKFKENRSSFPSHLKMLNVTRVKKAGLIALQTIDLTDFKMDASSKDPLSLFIKKYKTVRPMEINIRTNPAIVNMKNAEARAYKQDLLERFQAWWSADGERMVMDFNQGTEAEA